MKTRSVNGNMQARTGFFVLPIRRVVYGALAMVATTTLVVATASADAPARDVEDGSVRGDVDLRLTFEPSLALGAVDETESASGWVIEGGPYLNLVGIEGEALVAGVTADLDLSFGDIFDNFDLIAMSGRVEAWKDERWGIFFDGFFLQLDGDFNTPGPMVTMLHVDLTQVQLDLGLGMRLLDEPLHEPSSIDATGLRLRIDLLGGLRYQYLKEEITPSPLPTLGGSADWLEPFIGGRVELQFDDTWSVFVRGDAGGFGIGSASDLTWNLLTGVEYQLNHKMSLKVGYKVQGFDYSNGSGPSEFGGDWETGGLLLSMSMRF